MFIRRYIVGEGLRRRKEMIGHRLSYEPRCEKPGFCICENKDADQLRDNREADQRLVFPTRIVLQPLFYLNPKLQASSHLLWLYSPVCVGPGRKPRRPVFSRRGSYAVAQDTTAMGYLYL